MTVPSDGSGSADAAASRLRAVRRQAGLKLAAAARETGYSVSHLSNVERGIKPALPHLVQAYEALGSGGDHRPEERSLRITAVGVAPEADRTPLLSTPAEI